MQLYSPYTKLFDNPGIDTHSAIDDVKEFIRAVVYNGNISEVQTSVRLVQNLSSTTSQCIPPHPNSVEHCIKRAHLQTYYWLNCADSIIQPLLVEEYGWILENNEIKPRWFTGHQIPESLRRRKGKSYVADDENEMTENGPPVRKKKQIQPPGKNNNTEKFD